MPLSSTQTLEQSLALNGAVNFDLSFLQRIIRLIDLKILPLESQRLDLDAAIEAVRQVSLDRINEVLTPAIQAVLKIQERGYLVADSETSNTLGVGNVLTFNIPDEDERDIFTPSQFLFLSRVDNPDDWGIARLYSYDKITGTLIVTVTAYEGDEGPHDDWQISACAGSTIAQKALLTLAEEAFADTDAARDGAVSAAATATTKAGEASDSAADALTSKNAAAASAGTATTQAGIATTKAAEAAAIAAGIAAPTGSIVGTTDTQTLTNKTIDAALNALLNISLSMFAANVIDIDGTLAANSDSRLATQKALKTYIDGLLAAQDAMVFKGVIDCSANPNYPAANCGWTYRASVAGRIGGASGKVVEAGDIVICQTDGSAAGNEATVGANWVAIQVNIDGAVTLTGTQTLLNKTIATPIITGGLLAIQATSTGGSVVRLYEDTDNGTNYIDVKAPDNLTANRMFAFPANAPAVGQVVQATDTAGNTQWANPGGDVALLASLTPLGVATLALDSYLNNTLYRAYRLIADGLTINSSGYIYARVGSIAGSYTATNYCYVNTIKVVGSAVSYLEDVSGTLFPILQDMHFIRPASIEMLVMTDGTNAYIEATTTSYNSTGVTFQKQVISGMVNVSGSLAALQLLSSGTISGNVRLYGYKRQ